MKIKQFDKLVEKEKRIIKKANAMFEVLSTIGYYIPIESLINLFKQNQQI